MKRVVILGKSSYIGESLKKWLEGFPKQYDVQIVSTFGGKWKNADYSNVDTVVNFAGIAHINNISEDMKELFYSVNRDLAVEVGKFAKSQGVKQFVHFSSMNVYGDYCEHIIDVHSENPTSFYGDSKLQGDIGLNELEDDSFKVAYLRPPFVYGKGCKGNYNGISKIAQRTLIFPTYQNSKSMIYIDNLCEFVRLVIDNCSRGIFTPQNRELVSTSALVKEIATVHGKKIWFTDLFNWCIPIGIRLNRMIRKAFSNDCYDIEISNIFDNKYCVVDFKESIRRTEIDCCGFENNIEKRIG